ncbi:hypothetical protein [Niveispirillum cyanobacteriorum]|uniref:Uncharacterized protein n=1 Tax=Niveispirillum cyanobacteriorum TaxID=1612173 RepID=A0A2K9NAH8_9PROT|nr:hypothetical protein [Niveispirillum cyanobacteriorum]AUN30153.1 hypothetical protein C0V82_07845 [Niveispirillum cyanobacteriorum]GGE57444.1 hypothetical protein GCM10011317_14240 [Niveispirillum cyanobacteriorum]
MKYFDVIEASYLATDIALTERQAADEPGPLKIDGSPPTVTAQYVNERAYFVLLVAQFEDLVNNAVNAQVDQGRGSADWRTRELWGAVIPRTRRIQDIPFKLRLALLIDRQRVEYRDACGLYDARNLIAHGVLDGPLSIQTAINQLRAVASLIQEVP